MRARGSLVASALVLAGLGGCSTDDLANKALEDAGVEINTGGGWPSDFPAAVPTPDLPVETAVKIGEGFTGRLTSTDAVADVAAYRAALAAAGFTFSNEFDNSAAAAGNVGFTATGAGFTVTAVAFTAAAPGGGGYMGVDIQPG